MLATPPPRRAVQLFQKRDQAYVSRHCRIICSRPSFHVRSFFLTFVRETAQGACARRRSGVSLARLLRRAGPSGCRQLRCTLGLTNFIALALGHGGTLRWTSGPRGAKGCCCCDVLRGKKQAGTTMQQGSYRPVGKRQRYWPASWAHANAPPLYSTCPGRPLLCRLE